MGSPAVLSGRRTRGSGRFVRHFVEMALAMMVGMIASAAVLLSAVGMTVDEALRQHAVLFVVVQAFGMTVAMVAWMRHRGQDWRSCSEMAAAMVVPAIGLICLRLLDVISGPICGRTASQRSRRWCSSCSTEGATTAARLLSWPHADQAVAVESLAARSTVATAVSLDLLERLQDQQAVIGDHDPHGNTAEIVVPTPTGL